MEASLPISAAARLGTAAKAPALPAVASITLPLRFMFAGILALSAGTAWLILQPSVLATYHYNQHVIAVTHLFVLGWICSVVMGAMYQLVPVALETQLHSERLAKVQFVFHVVGFAGMVWMLRAWNMKQVGHFGAILAFGVLLFIYNIARTLLKVSRWNVVAISIASAIFWIGLTILAGLSLATAKLPFDPEVQSLSIWSRLLEPVAATVRQFNPLSAMHAHAHLGAIGFFVMLIVGVSYKLIPMFTLSEVQNTRRALTSVILLNAGLLGSFVSVLTSSPAKFGFALLIVSALALYGVELSAILRARKRGPIDWGVRYFVTAVVLLAPLSIVGVVLAWPKLPLNALTGQLENVYGFLGLIGVVTFAIAGMLYKIVPFLVWFGTYSRHIGKAKVPALGDLYSTRLQAAGYGLFLSGVLLTCVATLLEHASCVRLGSALIGGAVLTLILNFLAMLRHFLRPQLTPLRITTVVKPS
ncbi:MAG TPA: hypothetical protein VEH04_00705 [Verrucomicrobiae bacterium]|nr:hypothetical protein [Verrucomicrobiae bacterium]